MTETLLIVLLALAAITVVGQILLWRRQSTVSTPTVDFSGLENRLNLLNQSIQQTERGVADEFSRSRQELASQSQLLRLDITASLKSLSDSLLQQINALVAGNEHGLDQFGQSVGQRLEAFSAETTQKLELLRASLAEAGNRLQTQQSQELESIRSRLDLTTQQSREETATVLKGVSGSVVKSVADLTSAQKTQLEEIRTTVENRLTSLSADNEKRLEQMRQIVDEKLQGTLEARLGESFKQVSERLEQVHKGLGEMQSLASGVGDLKRVLTNVKTRGTWGEVQLGTLLDQMLTTDQYEKNVRTTGTQERVEFAIKLPGHEIGKPCWLPVDAKFPVEDYQRLVEASEQGDAVAVEAASRSLEITLRLCAKTISEKYLLPPSTTDFGILFLPTEGLYAEALRRVGLAETLQREYRVILTGPNTFAAILNSLQMGFRTLAIQQSSSEVWQTLGAVKTQFAKYADVLSKVKKKLQEASTTVEQAETRTRVLQRHLRDVESAPSESSAELSTLADFDLDELDEPAATESLMTAVEE
jgi:DNA recombination protein RmuC